MKIGVFDSGIGGKTIADTLSKDFTNAEVLYAHDSAHVPYGGRPKDEIITLTETAIQPLLDTECDCIVLACNTATAAAIEYLRSTYPDQKFIGLEPMVKPAVEKPHSGTIAVFATPYTLSSERYLGLKSDYAAKVTVLEPDCSEWANMIEHDGIDDEKIEKVVREVIDSGADVLVLACTHYHWIKEKIVTLAGKDIPVLDPSEAISQRVAQILP